MTDAQQSRQEELSARVRRYTWTMGVRTACFLLAALLPIPLVWRIPFILGGMVLPYIAVTIANAGPVRTNDRPVGYTDPDRRATPPKQIEGHTVIDV
ncbi:MAG TPA: DUF3099 domain-containing protein [Mycobacteriales bacterium]|nr:DUF3099 domain-containing protein [Mycobacteriales bacterium]